MASQHGGIETAVNKLKTSKLAPIIPAKVVVDF
jgi:hypothetical protein